MLMLAAAGRVSILFAVAAAAAAAFVHSWVRWVWFDEYACEGLAMMF
jgi:hypothetical protein